MKYIEIRYRSPTGEWVRKRVKAADTLVRELENGFNKSRKKTVHLQLKEK